MKMSEGIEAAKDAQAFLKKRPDLIVTDVPIKTLTRFHEIANEECRPRNGKAHYGFALKFLIDFYDGRIMDGSAIAEVKAEEALSQIAELRSTGTEEKVIKNVNGGKLNV